MSSYAVETSIYSIDGEMTETWRPEELFVQGREFELIDLLIEKGDTVNGTYTVVPINHPVDDTPVGDPNTCITFSPKISKSVPIRHNGARLCITSPTTMQIQFN